MIIKKNGKHEDADSLLHNTTSRNLFFFFFFFFVSNFSCSER